MGLRLALQSRPLCPAFYAISVRRLGTLPAASFRFHLTMDTLAVRLTLPTTKRVVDFHHQAIAHGGRTKKPSKAFQPSRVGDGAKGIRTPDLYNANVARYQLCYSPLFGNFSDHILHLVGFRCFGAGVHNGDFVLPTVLMPRMLCRKAPARFPSATDVYYHDSRQKSIGFLKKRKQPLRNLVRSGVFAGKGNC